MVVTRSSFENSEATSPTNISGPPAEIAVETVGDHDGNNSIASAPNPISVSHGLGARADIRWLAYSSCALRSTEV